MLKEWAIAQLSQHEQVHKQQAHKRTKHNLYTSLYSVQIDALLVIVLFQYFWLQPPITGRAQSSSGVH